MKLRGIELRRISMPLVTPFRTSFGTETTRDVLLVRVVTGEAIRRLSLQGFRPCRRG